jgi:hypothetical protein
MMVLSTWASLVAIALAFCGNSKGRRLRASVIETWLVKTHIQPVMEGECCCGDDGCSWNDDGPDEAHVEAKLAVAVESGHGSCDDGGIAVAEENSGGDDGDGGGFLAQVPGKRHRPTC